MPNLADQRAIARTSSPYSPCTSLALVGFMGAGKTTVGRELASRLGWHFEDLDDLIEKLERRTVEQIFQEDGEAEFRRLEFMALRRMVKSPRHDSRVIALGGGAFIEPAIQDCLQAANIPAVFLDAPGDELFRRCDQPEVRRPLRRDQKQFEELYRRRRPEYLKATMRMDTGGKTIGAVATEIISALNLVPLPGGRE